MPVAASLEEWYARTREKLRQAAPIRGQGAVIRARRWLVDTTPLPARTNELVAVRGRGQGWYRALLAALNPDSAQLLLLDAMADLEPGAAVETLGKPVAIPAGEEVIGRVIDPIGRPLDDGPRPLGPPEPVFRPGPQPMQRRARYAPMWTGVRAIDGLFTCARGQRIGVVGPPGTGKTLLLRAISSSSAADIVVLALVGERGREIVETAEHLFSRRRDSCVIVATPPHASPALRLLTAFSATAIAEHFRDRGAHVLLAVDSLTRMAHAQREIGLAMGELPAVRAYPPSVFSLIPQLVERAGAFATGSITGCYAVLLEAEDLAEPVADVTLASLDGHIVLSRDLANRGVYPPVDVLRSLSRLMPNVVDDDHRGAAAAVREMLQVYEESRDIIETGLYRPGTRQDVDRAIRALPLILDFISQDADETATPDDTLAALRVIIQEAA